MSMDKEKMLDTSNDYVKIVSSAQNACDKASRALMTAEYELSSSWSGKSGEAMEQAISEMRNEINMISVRLASLKAKMAVQAQNIYNSWQENDNLR